MYRKAIELKPDNAAACRNLVRVYCVKANARKRSQSVARRSNSEPNNAKSYNILAWILATATETKDRDPGRAVELAQKAVELAPQDADFWNTLGVAQYRAGDWQATIAGLKKSMDLGKGGNSLDWFFLAMADWKLGNKDAARVWYDKALEWMEKNDPANEELIRFRAEAAELLGLPQPATESTPREDSTNPRHRQR